MIPFFHIVKQGTDISSTPEQKLAVQMANLPADTETVSGSRTLSEFIPRICGDAVGLIFDDQFWYSPACWERWLSFLTEDGLENMPNLPVGNQDPAWRQDVSVPPYVTLRGLETAAETCQSFRWKKVRAQRLESFAAMVLPRGYLADMDPDLALESLPYVWVSHQIPVRLFGNGWLHSFNALRDAGHRHDLLSMVDWHGTVLELGCGQGLMAKACKENGGQVRWVGVDLNISALSAARSHVDLAIQADAEFSLPISRRFRFDRVVCGDFLEHLPYPWQFLKRLRTRMAPEGLLIASFPNVGHWTVIEDLLSGRWDETPSGILCVTHLRFGTRQSWGRWFENAGWQIVRWESERLVLPHQWRQTMPILNEAADMESLETLRYRIVARPVKNEKR
jgi:SAM-dependent methyltransferase